MKSIELQSIGFFFLRKLTVFFTNDQARLAFIVADEGVSGWEIVEVPLRLPFFLVDVTAEHDGESVTKTFLVGSQREICDLAESHAESNLKIDAIHVICPESVAKGADWEMHRMAKIYRADEPMHSQQSCYVYESVDGKKFIDSLMGTTIDDLNQLTELHSFT